MHARWSHWTKLRIWQETGNEQNGIKTERFRTGEDSNKDTEDSRKGNGKAIPPLPHKPSHFYFFIFHFTASEWDYGLAVRVRIPVQTGITVVCDFMLPPRCKLRTALFRVVTQHTMVVSYRLFVTTFRYHLKGSSSPRRMSGLWIWAI